MGFVGGLMRKVREILRLRGRRRRVLPKHQRRRRQGRKGERYEYEYEYEYGFYGCEGFCRWIGNTLSTKKEDISSTGKKPPSLPENMSR
jgi:hypothetical protein